MDDKYEKFELNTIMDYQCKNVSKYNGDTFFIY